MKNELLNKEVLAMYDVRGIQSYIFKTNKIKEIIGASVVIDNIILDGLKEYIKDKDDNLYHIYWKSDDKHNVDEIDSFIKEDSDILMQVMFVGGGNAYVLFRTGEECKKVNRFLAKYVLDKTYSLNLAVAVVEKTDSYKNDYNAINEEMRRIKACMPNSMPVGAFPFMNADSITGYPISSKMDDEYLCTESYLKRKASNKEDSETKILDDLVTKKGDNSTLALVHMDGNSLGKRIMNIMKDVDDYYNAIKTMRILSSGIDNSFKFAFDKMIEKTSKLSNKDKWYRKIVLAGDDITFICNARLALSAVEIFLKELNKVDTSFIKTKDDSNPIFTACAGIVYCNSHFPFSDAYKTAEACLDNAKDVAKNDERSIDEWTIGNYIDFQLCSNINSSNLEDYREKHYKVDDKLFISRPYYLEVENDKGLNEKNKDYSFEIFKNKMESLSKLPRSVSKEIRNIIPIGDNEIEKEIYFLKSRNHDGFDDLKKNKGIYYDALELLDFRMENKDENRD